MQRGAGGQVVDAAQAAGAQGATVHYARGTGVRERLGILGVAVEAEKAGMDCVISTGDKDMAQLVSEHTTLTNTMTNTDMDREGVKEKFDVSPEQIVGSISVPSVRLVVLRVERGNGKE